MKNSQTTIEKKEGDHVLMHQGDLFIRIEATKEIER